MATKAIKHFRLRELARAPPPPPVLKPSTSSAGSLFDFTKFDFLQPTRVASEASTNNFPKRANPFIPTKNPQTGRWAPPKYSLRQQADLIKKARASGTLALLPSAPKTSAAHLAAISFAKAQPVIKKPQPQGGLETQTEADANGSEEHWSQPIEWVGEVKERKVPGAEIGNRLYAGKKRMFKGHKWERAAEKRALKRKMLMRDMAKRIQRYKQASLFWSRCLVFAYLQFLPLVSQEEATKPTQALQDVGREASILDIVYGASVIALVFYASCLVAALLPIPIINSSSLVNSFRLPVTGCFALGDVPVKPGLILPPWTRMGAARVFAPRVPSRASV